MASTSVGTDILTEKAVRHYTRSLWRDPFFVIAFVLLVINVVMVTSVFYSDANYLGFMNSFYLFLALAFLALIPFMCLRTHEAIRGALGPSGSEGLRDMSVSSLQRIMLQTGMQVPRLAFLWAVLAFDLVLRVLFKALEHR